MIYLIHNHRDAREPPLTRRWRRPWQRSTHSGESFNTECLDSWLAELSLTAVTQTGQDRLSEVKDWGDKKLTASQITSPSQNPPNQNTQAEKSGGYVILQIQVLICLHQGKYECIGIDNWEVLFFLSSHQVYPDDTVATNNVFDEYRIPKNSNLSCLGCINNPCRNNKQNIWDNKLNPTFIKSIRMQSMLSKYNNDIMLPKSNRLKIKLLERWVSSLCCLSPVDCVAVCDCSLFLWRKSELVVQTLWIGQGLCIQLISTC